MSKEESNKCKIFVGGLHLKTDSDGLKEYFSQWGEVTDAIVMCDPSKRSRGFGFVTYKDPKSVDDCLESKPHEVDGKTVEAKLAVSKEAMSMERDSSHARTKKVFLGGLDPSTTKDDISAKLKDFGGEIVEIQIMTDKHTEKPRGFAFATFEDYDTADKVCKAKYISILEREVEVKKAKSQDELKKLDPRPSPRNFPPSGFGYGVGRDMYPPRAGMFDMGRMPGGYDYGTAYDDYYRTAREQASYQAYSMPSGYDRTGGSGYSYGAAAAARGVAGYDMSSSPYGNMYNASMMGSYSHSPSSYGPARGYPEYRDRGDRGDSRSSSSYHPYKR